MEGGHMLVTRAQGMAENPLPIVIPSGGQRLRNNCWIGR